MSGEVGSFAGPGAGEFGAAVAWSAVTVAAYVTGLRLHRLAKGHPLVNVLALATALVIGALFLIHAPYVQYARASTALAKVLGPATVALALPLYRSLGTLRSALAPVLAGLAAASGVALGSAVSVGWLLGASPVAVRSLAPKSVTTPIAIAISRSIGGNAALTAALVIVTGTFGAMVVPGVFRLIGVEDARARGLAIGVAAHGIGTARALALGVTEGAYSALGMSLAAVVTPIVVPLIAPLLP